MSMALKKERSNAIKEAIKSPLVYLTNYKHIEDAEKEVKHLKRNCDGYTAIGLKKPDLQWIQYHIKNVELLEAIPKLIKFKDIYISINSMLSPLRQLKNLRHLHAFWVDLDYYKIKRFKNKSSEEIIEIMRKKKLFKDAEPSFFIDSGNGLYIFYLIESASVGALPIWQKIQNSFVERFLKYGADPMSADAVHVLRLAGTENTKTGRKARFLYNSQKEFEFEKSKDPIKIYTIEDLSKAMLPALPHSKEEWEKLKEAKRQTKKVKEMKKEVALFNLHTLHFARLNDIQTIQKLREGHCDGIRELMCFLYRYYNCLFIKDSQCALINALDFNKSFKNPLNESEVIKATKSAEKAYELWENTFNKYITLKDKPPISAYFRKAGCYIYSNRKLISLLNITEAEMCHLSTIISTKEKNKRAKDYRNQWKKADSKKKRRNDYGLTLRQQNKLNNLVNILKLQKDGLKQKEIAAKLNITQQAVSKLLREYKNNTLDSNILNQLKIEKTATKPKEKAILNQNFKITDIKDIAN